MAKDKYKTMGFGLFGKIEMVQFLLMERRTFSRRVLFNVAAVFLLLVRLVLAVWMLAKFHGVWKLFISFAFVEKCMYLLAFLCASGLARLYFGSVLSDMLTTCLVSLCEMLFVLVEAILEFLS
ncbi:unnamed protein product [Trifolium pratense]|uniref:Uncharacterized protein n=2 Tax=Trifolium pratense TaxID=57577 RepID=A0ACB0LDM5_TRIPR|nr:unnamed protein product [Trifolium pratense]CAJ2666743.1 unnamed protein product [Trifolium pratense]